MANLKILLALVFIACAAINAHADHIDCGFVTVGKLYTQSDRSDGSSHGNKLLVEIGDGCPPFGCVANSAAAYNGILSMLLAAKLSDKEIRIVVSDEPPLSGAARIEWVNF